MKKTVSDRVCYFANGTPLFIEAGSESGTAIYYYENGQKKYINDAGQAGDDLSEAWVLGGSHNADGLRSDTSITMTGGEVEEIHAGQWSGYVWGNTSIYISENASVSYVQLSSQLDGEIIGTITAFIGNGAEYYGTADNMIYKSGNGIQVTGSAVIPEGFTLTVPEGTTFTIPEGVQINNQGTIENNGTIIVNAPVAGDGTIKNNGTIIANASVAEDGTIENNGEIIQKAPIGTPNTITGSGTWSYHAVSVETKNTSAPSVWIDNVQTEDFKTEYSGGKLYIYGLTTGNVKVMLGETSYYGTLENTEQETPLTSDYVWATEISCTWDNLNISVPVNLATYTVVKPENLTLNTICTYEIIEDETTALYTLEGSVLTPKSAGKICIKITSDDAYSQCSMEKEWKIEESGTLDISEGGIIIKATADGYEVTYPKFQGGTKTYSAGEAIYITGTSDEYTIRVESGTPDVVLNDCSVTSSDSAAFYIAPGASVNLIINGTNTMATTSEDKTGVAGIFVSNGAMLTLSGTGSLTAKGGYYSSGIGGGYEDTAGDIIINGGTIDTESQTSGYYEDSYGNGISGRSITINGGIITATAYKGAGIGGTYNNESNATVVTINGGTVTATSNGGAGIGGGYNGSGGNIYINGGTVIAESSNGAGIGGGFNGSGGNIYINGGTVTATAVDGAGIGGGYNGSGGNIYISGGTVTAENINYGAGIGGGRNGSGGIITISGGTINASCTYWKNSASGIGDGNDASGGTVIVKGGNIKATSKRGSSVSGTPIDGNGNSVSLKTITLDGASADTVVTAVTGITYGIKDVKTLDTDKLYFYLPSGAAASFTAGESDYCCTADKQADNQTYYTSHDWSNNDGICTRCGETCDHEGQDGTCDICGKNLHTHSWTYTVDGKTITAACTAAYCDDPSSGSVTIVEPAALTYTGSAIEAVVTDELKTGDTYQVTYTAAEGSSLTYDKPVNAGSYEAVLSVDTDSGKKETSISYTIAQKSLNIASATVQEKVYDKTKTAVLNDIIVDGLIGSDSVNVNATAEFAQTGAGENITVNITNITLSGYHAKNYTIPGTFETTGKISPKPVTVYPAVNQTKEYNTADPEFSYTIKPELLEGDSLTGALGRITGETIGEYDFTTGTLANANYVITVDKTNKFAITQSTPDIAGVKATIPDNQTAITAITFTGASVAGKYTVTSPAVLTWGANTVFYTFAPEDDNYQAVSGQAEVTVKDTIVPSGEVTMKTEEWEGTWKELLNEITFNRLFNKTVEVSVTAKDTLSGIDKIAYYETAEVLSLDQIKTVTDWTEMKVEKDDTAGKASISVPAADAKQFVYYIRIMDKDGNVAYLSTDGAIFDTQAPVITGITDGAVYYTTQKFTVTEIHPGKVTVNEQEVSDYTLTGNTEAVYQIVATDSVGNSSKVTVTMKTISSLIDSSKDLTLENITGDQAELLQAAKETLSEVITEDSTKYATETELQELKKAQEELDRINSLIESIERVEDAGKKIEDAADAASGVNTADLPGNADVVNKLAEAKQAYEALSEKEKTLLDAAQIQKLTELYEDAVYFQIIKGMDGVYTKGTSAGLEFTANGAFDLFAGVRVDGEMVDASDYTAESGSTVVALKAEYLKTLDNGDHSFEVLYDVLGTQYSADCVFTVKKAPAAEQETEAETAETQTEAKAANTGDDTNMTLWLSMMLASVLCVLLLLRSKKRKNYN